MLKSAAKAGGSGSKNSPAQRANAPITNGQPRSWRGPKNGAVNSAVLDKNGRGMKKDQMSPSKNANKIIMSEYSFISEGPQNYLSWISLIKQKIHF